MSKGSIINFLVFLAVVGTLGYVIYASGAMKNIMDGQFDKALTNVTSFVSMGSVDLSSSKGKGFGKGMIKMIVPEIMYAQNDVNNFKEIFAKNKKVVFYTYTPQEADDAKAIKNFIQKNYSGTYTDLSMKKETFMDRKADVASRNNGCSTMEECKQMQKNSSTYAQITSFLDRCQKGICIIDNTKRRYVRTNTKDMDAVKDLLKRYLSE